MLGMSFDGTIVIAQELTPLFMQLREPFRRSTTS